MRKFLCHSQAKQNSAQCLHRAGHSQHGDSSGAANLGISRAFGGCSSPCVAAELGCSSSAWLWLHPAGPRSRLGCPETDSARDRSGRGGQRQERRQEDRAWGTLHIMWLCCVADLWMSGWLQWEQGGDSSPVARQDHSLALPFVCHRSALRNTDLPSRCVGISHTPD